MNSHINTTKHQSFKTCAQIGRGAPFHYLFSCSVSQGDDMQQCQLYFAPIIPMKKLRLGASDLPGWHIRGLGHDVLM